MDFKAIRFQHAARVEGSMADVFYRLGRNPSGFIVKRIVKKGDFVLVDKDGADDFIAPWSAVVSAVPLFELEIDAPAKEHPYHDHFLGKEVEAKTEELKKEEKPKPKKRIVKRIPRKRPE